MPLGIDIFGIRAERLTIFPVWIFLNSNLKLLEPQWKSNLFGKKKKKILQEFLEKVKHIYDTSITTPSL